MAVTGSVQKKNNKWYMVINRYVDGKRKRQWLPTGLNIRGNKNAEAMLAEKLSEINKNCTPLCNITVAEYFKR